MPPSSIVEQLRRQVDATRTNAKQSHDESVSTLFALTVALALAQLQSRLQQLLRSCSCNSTTRIVNGERYARLTHAVPETINEEDWERYTTMSGLLFPVAPRKFAWDLLILFLILYSSVTVPFRLGMNHAAEGAWWIFEVSVSLCFITDLCITFNTAYFDGDQFVLDRERIRNNYLKGWFVIDLTSSIPVRCPITRLDQLASNNNPLSAARPLVQCI